MLVGYLVNFESHTNVGSRETSLFIKICLFRWTNTAIILYLTTPFTRRLESDTLITLVYSLFFTEITTTPILQLSDYYGNYQRHIVAPRAPDRRRMMQCFEGTPYSLSERYTVSIVSHHCAFLIYPKLINSLFSFHHGSEYEQGAFSSSILCVNFSSWFTFGFNFTHGSLLGRQV